MTILQPTLHKWSQGGRQDGLWEKGCKEKHCNLWHILSISMTLWYYICTKFCWAGAARLCYLCLRGPPACTCYLWISESSPQPIYSLPSDLAEFCNLTKVWLVRCNIKWNWFVLQQDWWEDQRLGVKYKEVFGFCVLKCFYFPYYFY